MGIIRWDDILTIAVLVAVLAGLFFYLLYAFRKGLIRIEGRSWRNTENYVRRSRRRSEKKESGVNRSP